MSDFDCEIEFLDEDAEVVQQCFSYAENVPSLLTEAHYKPSNTLDSDATNASDIDEAIESKLSTKIVARRRMTRSQTLLSQSNKEPKSSEGKDLQAKNVIPQNSAPSSSKSKEKTNKRRRKKEEDDTDYDPQEDLEQLRSVKRKKFQPVKMKLETPSKAKAVKVDNSDLGNKNDLSRNRITETGYINVFNEKLLNRNQLLQRNKLNIKIPDYDDPLCLPVKMMIKDSNDKEKIQNWNNLCLDHLQNSDMMLKPDSGQTKCSKRIIIFRNVRNKNTGKVETTIWSKTSVENERKEKKSEVFQTILPRYRDNTVMHYNLRPQSKHRTFSNKNEVILTREEDKDGQILVAYRPNEAISSVYKIDGRRNGLITKDDDDTTSGPEDEEKKICLKETTNCRVCAPCYQASWRGARQYDKEIYCAICSRTFATIFNLISHLKMHTKVDVRKHIGAISKEFAKVMDYHYKCRICLKRFSSIKELRQHLLTHRGKEKFLCEIGNHVTT